MSTNLPVKKQIDWSAWLFWTAIAFALGEFIDAFSLGDPTTGIVFAALIAACASWFRLRGSRISLVILLVLSAFEFIALIFIYPHGPTPPAPWRGAIFIALSSAVAILSVLSFIRPRKK